MVLASVVVYLLSWPLLYTNFYNGLKFYWVYTFQSGISTGTQWQIGPLLQTVTTMPEMMLIFLGIGLVFVIARLFRENSYFWHLLLLWLIVPILRTSIPGAVNFDGIRHFLEFVPAAALIAGFGLEQSIQSVAGKKWLPEWSIRLIALALITVNVIQIYSVYYPDLHLYYNEFTGGFEGAKELFLGSDATDYWAVSYRPGIEWLDENVPHNSRLVTPVAYWVVNIEAPVLLRPDIKIVPGIPPGAEMMASKEPFFLMFIDRPLSNPALKSYLAYVMQHGKLVHQIFVDHVPVLYIYKFGGN
jgi:hypothetical protein